jgi:putative ABC transport system permease protein
MDVLTQVTNALKFFLVAIAAIALVVGGIGIMNIMLVAVSERIREVGLRKAVGAKKSSILFQFLVETIIISLMGGIVGIIFGSLLAVVVALVARYLGYDWALVISIESIVLSVGFSVFVGIIFGIYPALKAAKLNPIDALHYE